MSGYGAPRSSHKFGVKENDVGAHFLQGRTSVSGAYRWDLGVTSVAITRNRADATIEPPPKTASAL